MTVSVLSLLDASVHLTVIVYKRPFPPPSRSARRSTVRSPVISKSSASPVSLSLTPVMTQPGLGSTLSVTITETVTERIPFTERGTFSYGRTVEGGVYDHDRLEAPEPLFRQLIDELPFQYEYQLIPSAPGDELSNVVGSYRLRAELSQANGWKRTIELQPTMLFGGGQFSTSVTIDLGEVDKQIESIEQSTGIDSKLYTLRVIAEVTAQGRLDDCRSRGSCIRRSSSASQSCNCNSIRAPASSK